jgi:hypothetical protein
MLAQLHTLCPLSIRCCMTLAALLLRVCCTGAGAGWPCGSYACTPPGADDTTAGTGTQRVCAGGALCTVQWQGVSAVTCHVGLWQIGYALLQHSLCIDPADRLLCLCLFVLMCLCTPHSSTSTITTCEFDQIFENRQQQGCKGACSMYSCYPATPYVCAADPLQPEAAPMLIWSICSKTS